MEVWIFGRKTAERLNTVVVPRRARICDVDFNESLPNGRLPSRDLTRPRSKLPASATVLSCAEPDRLPINLEERGPGGSVGSDTAIGPPDVMPTVWLFQVGSGYRNGAAQKKNRQSDMVEN